MNIALKTSKKATATWLALAILVACAGVLLILRGASASTATPPWEPDTNAIGALTFFDSSGNQITGGNLTDAPLAAFVQGTAAVRNGDTKATLFGYLPKNGVNPGAWSGEQLGLSTTYPNAAAPGALGTSPLPLNTGGKGDESLALLYDDFPNTDTTSDGYGGLYELRLRTTAAGSTATVTYDRADIQFNNVTLDGSGSITGGTWSVVYPVPAVVTTPTGPSSTPTGPSSTPTTPSTTPTGPSSTPTTPSTTPTGPSSTPTTPSTTPTGPSSTPTTPSTTPTGPSSTPTTPSTTPTGPSSTPTTPSTTPTGPSSTPTTPSTTPTGPSSTPTTPSTTPTGPSSTPTTPSTTPTGPSSTPTTPSTTPTGPSSTPTTPSTTPTDPSTTPTTPSSTSSAATAGTIGATDVNGNPLSPGFTATPGESIQLTASGLTANAPYTIVLHSTPVTLASVISSASGTATFTMVVPAAIASGAHTVQFVAADGTIGATMSFSVAAVSNAAATSPLANTGTNSRLPIELALLFIASGGLLLVAVRRRPRGKHLS